ncbi:S1 family peptidase [Aeromicrobium sp.]|uniref:S1 family peptidase n=1 Tax=Aeromicrobium sp. TaxID=1871063 RepID=UPI0019AC9F3C|nr:S1 family peptidase [Aeromicrobium sp.]MBC7633958.1 alpha-lytic protease prodomain-containing protein [Aeromicrobium sp.]
MTHNVRVFTASVALALGAVTVLGQQAGVAQPTPEGESGRSSMGSAMQRDLGMTAPQAKTRMAAEDKAAKSEKSLRRDLGASFGGAWFDADSSKLVVGVTSGSKADTVREAGAEPRQVSRSEKQLGAYLNKLDAARSKAPESVPGWYVDVKSNKVVVQSRASSLVDARSFATSAGVPSAAVTVERSDSLPRPLNVVGGNAYYIGGSRCSIGFSVNGGFVSAGHCGSAGDTTSQPTGTFAGSSFPGNDYSYIRTGDVLVGGVNDYAGGIVAVTGSGESPIGSSICRSGSTTGWHCGTIGARDATVNYSQGSVYGLIKTNVCAEPGDSGGSAISGNRAQGVTSGGSGNCSSGGETYFQPVNEILGAYGLSLITG